MTLKRVKEIKETNSCNLTTQVFCGCVCSSIMLRGGETRTVARYFCMRSHRLMSRTSCHLHCLLMFNYANAAIASLKQFEIFYEYLYLATNQYVSYITYSQTAYPVNKINRICFIVIFSIHPRK